MSFKPSCCCPFHVDWGFGPADSPGIVLRRADYTHKTFCGLTDPKNKSRKRKICAACDDKIVLIRSLEKVSKVSVNSLRTVFFACYNLAVGLSRWHSV